MHPEDQYAVRVLRAGAPLSNRELEVLVRLASAQSTKAIAADLAMSPKTASTYRSRD